jgi:hypothetical protein
MHNHRHASRTHTHTHTHDNSYWRRCHDHKTQRDSEGSTHSWNSQGRTTGAPATPRKRRPPPKSSHTHSRRSCFGPRWWWPVCAGQRDSGNEIVCVGGGGASAGVQAVAQTVTHTATKRYPRTSVALDPYCTGLPTRGKFPTGTAFRSIDIWRMLTQRPWPEQPLGQAAVSHGDPQGKTCVV